MSRILTVGHGTLPAPAFAELLHDAGVKLLVDVRTAPGSRRVPHFNRETLEGWLPAGGFAYTWEPELGGFRKADPESRNTRWRHLSFRGYADYMGTDAFVTAMSRILIAAEEWGLTAVMCAESVWWRCHRRMVADGAVLLGASVNHLMHNGAVSSHPLTEGAHLEDGTIIYGPEVPK